MRHRFLQLLMLSLFAFVATWHVQRLRGIDQDSEQRVQRTTATIAADDPDASLLYGRREFYLPVLPRHAWVEVLARGSVSVYFNGKMLKSKYHAGCSTSVCLSGVTKLAERGTNVVAVVVNKRKHGVVPRFACRFGYEAKTAAGEFQSVVYSQESADGPADFVADSAAGNWQVSTQIERDGTWWYKTDFDSTHWDAPRECDREDFRIASPVAATPVRQSPPTDWLQGRSGEQTAWSYECHVDSAPQAAWVRVIANGAYRLSVNGQVAAVEQRTLGTGQSWKPRYLTYDINRLLRPGRNHIALLVENPLKSPAAAIDGGIRLADSSTVNFESADFSEVQTEDSEVWLAAHSKTVPARLVPASAATAVPLTTVNADIGDVVVSQSYRLAVLRDYAFVFAAILACSLVITEIVRQLVRLLHGRSATWFLVSLPWLIPTLILGLVWVGGFDPRISSVELLDARGLVWTMLSVPVCWSLYFLFSNPVAIRQTEKNDAGSARTANQSAGTASAGLSRVSSRIGAPGLSFKQRPAIRSASWILLLITTSVGFGLRVHSMQREPLHHDEVITYCYAEGIFERGYPSTQIHPDLPLDVCETSELMHYFIAPAMLLTDDPRLALRCQAVLFSTATIALLFFVGRRWLDEKAGHLAAIVFALAPYCIAVGTFGRYSAALGFFALLTTDFFARTIAGRGRIHGGWLATTAVLFLVMYMTWQASALLAFGLIAAMFVVRGMSVFKIVFDYRVWIGIVLVGGCVVLHLGNRINAMTSFIAIGEGISTMELALMWRNPFFKPFFFLSEAVWLPDTLLPLAGLTCAALISLRPQYVALRFFTAVPVAAALMMGLFLPILAARYAFHLLPCLLLVNAGAVAWVLDRLNVWNLEAGLSRGVRFVNAAILLFALCVWLIPATGHAFHMTESRWWHNEQARQGDVLHADWQVPVDYLREHIQPGDVVITDLPHILDLLMNRSGARADDGGPWRSDAWLQSVQVILATMSDDDFTVRSRMSGNLVLHDAAAVEEFLNRHQRVWYLGAYFYHNPANDTDVKTVILEHMDVVCEEARCALLLHDDQHRTATHRRSLQTNGDSLTMPWRAP